MEKEDSVAVVVSLPLTHLTLSLPLHFFFPL